GRKNDRIELERAVFYAHMIIVCVFFCLFCLFNNENTTLFIAIIILFVTFVAIKCIVLIYG
uniref:hypothetical protein n=1 Tax=Dialister invisus TaxID=218538 RepID=UPI003C703D22